jgi:membrane fusion protein (multidrug efflux system)
MDRFEAVGTIDAGESITVVAEIDALVMTLPFREGAMADSGTLLAQLDDSQLRAQEARASALLAMARVNLDRVRSLVEKGAAAQQDLDNASSAYKVAEADLELAEARLSKTRITAPFRGIVGTRRVSPGAYIRAGEAITDLAQMDQIKVTFSAPERYLSELHFGAEILVSTPAFEGQVLTGSIDVIEPVLDPVTRSARILARARNPKRLFRPGMSADVTVVLSRRDSAVTVPSEAVFAQGDQSFVFVVKPDSTVTRSLVSLGSRTPAAVEVISGLDAGMQVVRAGHQKLYEGARVMPIQSQAAGGAGEGS